MFRKLWARANLLTLTPIAVSNSYCWEMRDGICSMVKHEKFDIVQVEYIPMGQYVSEIRNAVTIFNVHDLISATAKKCVQNLHLSRRKLEWFIDSILSRRYEAQVCAKFDWVLTASSKIKEDLLASNPLLNISAIPPGVDIPSVHKDHTNGKGENLIFMGAMWRQENVDAVLYFYQSVLGHIRKAIPEVVLHIVGGSPSAEVRQLAADPGVKVTGYVEDLLPLYLKCDVSVAPIRIAGGVMCKILDAMAAGLPVVTTSAGNEGIRARPEEEIIVADTPEDFARRTIELLRNGSLRNAIGQRGLDFVRRNFNWDQIIEKLEKVYQECLGESR